MKCYIVIGWMEHDGFSNLKVYTDKDLAEKFKQKCEQYQKDNKHPYGPDLPVRNDIAAWTKYGEDMKIYNDNHPVNGRWDGFDIDEHEIEEN